MTRGCPEPPCFGNGIVDDVARGPHYLGVGEKDQKVTKGCPEASCFGTGIADDEGVGGVGDRFGPHRALLILRSLDHKDPLVSVLNGPTLAKARERPDLQATATAADPFDL